MLGIFTSIISFNFYNNPMRFLLSLSHCTDKKIVSEFECMPQILHPVIVKIRLFPRNFYSRNRTVRQSSILSLSNHGAVNYMMPSTLIALLYSMKVGLSRQIKYGADCLMHWEKKETLYFFFFVATPMFKGSYLSYLHSR